MRGARFVAVHLFYAWREVRDASACRSTSRITPRTTLPPRLTHATNGDIDRVRRSIDRAERDAHIPPDVQIHLAGPPVDADEICRGLGEGGERVVGRVGDVVRGAGGAGPPAPVHEQVALGAVKPVVLAVGGAGVGEQREVSAGGGVVDAGGGTAAGGRGGEGEAEAFGAKLPVGLAGEVWVVGSQAVDAAAGLVVVTAAGARVVAVEGQALALAAPAPSVLAARCAVVDGECVRGTAGVVMGAAGRAGAQQGVAGEVQPLAFCTPLPIALAVDAAGAHGDAVVSDRSVDMCVSCRTQSHAEASVYQSLAFGAALPAFPALIMGLVEHEVVRRTCGMVMHGTGWTTSTAGPRQTLTFIAPSPFPLANKVSRAKLVHQNGVLAVTCVPAGPSTELNRV